MCKMAIRLAVAKAVVPSIHDDCSVTVGKRKGTAYVFNVDEGSQQDDGYVRHIKIPGDKAFVYTGHPGAPPDKAGFILPYWVAISTRRRLCPTSGLKPLGELIDVPTTIKLRPHQEVDMRQIVAQLNDRGCSLFVARPGYGKTIMFIYAISVIRQRTLIVLPSRLNLAKQTQKALGDYVSGQGRIGILGTDGIISPECDILIAMVGRLGKLGRLRMRD